VSAPTVLLFDLGGVLVHTKGFTSIKALLGLSDCAEARDDQLVRDRWLSSPSVRDFELGRATAPEFAARFVAEWELSVSSAAFLADLAVWIDHVYPGAEELLATLRKRYRVCCFSNCNELHWEMMAEFLQCFDDAFSSHLLGHIKPDEEAFRAVLRTLEVGPDQVLFFDDSRANVVAAEELGIRSFLVHGPEEARCILEREGAL
jgi:HAD superfamily hydrolase (TIGR01509 family)